MFWGLCTIDTTQSEDMYSAIKLIHQYCILPHDNYCPIIRYQKAKYFAIVKFESLNSKQAYNIIVKR